jgi:hypothetical protein
MLRVHFHKMLVGLAVAVTLVGFGRGSAYAQVKLVKPPSGGTIKVAKPGSYFLGSNLNSALLATPAIKVTANNVTINLNGFSIIGAGRNGTAAGINGANVSGLTIVNGTITKIAGPAIVLGSNSTVAGVQVIDNTGDGVDCASACLVTNNVVSGNTGTRLNFADSTSGYQNNIVSGNGGTVTGGSNMGHNVCNGSLTC